MTMRAAAAAPNMEIDLLRTAEGCSQRCKGCGSYEGMKPKDFKVVDLTREEVRQCLEMALSNGFTFAEFMATDVNTEPLDGKNDAFMHYAEEVHQMTGGLSRVVCISHGLRVSEDTGRPISKMKRRLKHIVKMMCDDKIPLFVLSVDCARLNAEISREENIASYVATLEELRPALQAGKRVTISLQGQDVPDSADYRGKSEEVFAEVLKQTNLSLDERARLHWDKNRPIVKVGRAREFLEGLSDEAACDVIPDYDFMKAYNEKRKDLLFRGRLNIRRAVNGVVPILERQIFEPGRTYNTTVKGPWEQVAMPDGSGEDCSVNSSDSLVQIGSSLPGRLGGSHSQAEEVARAGASSLAGSVQKLPLARAELDPRASSGKLPLPTVKSPRGASALGWRGRG